MMEQKNQISKRSAGYSLLKSYVKFWFRIYYRISYHGRDQIVYPGRYILASNHQNALMDALAILTSFPWQPVFLARSDLFASKIAARILTFLKMLPVYRIRDGIDQLSNNDDVFQSVFQVLETGTPAGILPEGNHDDRKLLRPLKKGIARIGFNQRHQAEKKEDVSIIPIGLNYEDHHKQGSRLHIRFGKPLPLSDYDALYEENQPRAYNQFLKDLHGKMKELMLHVENMECYETCSDVADIYGITGHAMGNSPDSVFMNQKKLIEITEDLFENQKEKYLALEETADKVKTLLQTLGLRLKDLINWKTAINTVKLYLLSALLVLTFPLYLYSFIQNIIPSLLVNKIKGLFKDPQFISTAIFTGTIFVFPLIHLIQTLLAGIISGSTSIALMYAATLLPSWFVFTWWRSAYGSVTKAFKIKRVKDDISQLIHQLETITGVSFLSKGA